jgi:hypothetical protein
VLDSEAKVESLSLTRQVKHACNAAYGCCYIRWASKHKHKLVGRMILCGLLGLAAVQYCLSYKVDGLWSCCSGCGVSSAGEWQWQGLQSSLMSRGGVAALVGGTGPTGASL